MKLHVFDLNGDHFIFVSEFIFNSLHFKSYLLCFENILIERIVCKEMRRGEILFLSEYYTTTFILFLRDSVLP